MKNKYLFLPTLFLVLTGCALEQPAGPTSGGMTGADRDAHGCINSAGYIWCERTEQCERPWELAESAGFENTQEEYDKFCGN